MGKKIDQFLNKMGKFIDDHEALVASGVCTVLVGSILYITCSAFYSVGYIAGEAAARATTAELIDRLYS